MFGKGIFCYEYPMCLFFEVDTCFEDENTENFEMEQTECILYFSENSESIESLDTSESIENLDTSESIGSLDTSVSIEDQYQPFLFSY